jgi:hypothetical protein
MSRVVSGMDDNITFVAAILAARARYSTLKTSFVGCGKKRCGGLGCTGTLACGVFAVAVGSVTKPRSTKPHSQEWLCYS